MAIPYAVSTKLIFSGAFVEVYDYSRPYWVGWPRYRRLRPKSMTRPIIKPQEAMRDDNVRRTRIKIRRLINSNQDLDRFFTITFADNITDFDYANRQLANYIRSIKKLYPNFKYLAVPEFQKRGAIHYHILCNLPFIEVDILTKMWGKGFVFLRKINHVDNVGAYVCKYLGKANFDTRYFKRKKFFYSLNLNRPVVVDKFLEVRHLLPYISKISHALIYSFSFDTKYLGGVQYSQYKAQEILKVNLGQLINLRI